MVQTAEHFATSKLDIRDGRILLMQQFRENDFHDSSAVAISVVGRKSKARYLNESTVQLSVAPGKGRFTVLISSAASFDPNQDVGALALAELQAAEAKGFKSLQTETADWWRDFWSKGFVYMHSADGQADFVEQNYTYFLYLMGASSRGAYPPRFGGMLWRTTRRPEPLGFAILVGQHAAPITTISCRRTGSNSWTRCSRFTPACWTRAPWLPGNNGDRKESGFPKSRSSTAGKTAGRHRGRVAGFDARSQALRGTVGEVSMVRRDKEPPSRALEFSGRRTLGPRPFRRADQRRPALSRTTAARGRKSSATARTSSSVGSRIGALAWQRYQFTMDKDWLRDRAYPFIKGSAEFYRNFPNFKKDADGKYHIHHVNNGESPWNSSDTPYEVSCHAHDFSAGDPRVGNSRRG